ncbi:MAG: J domain-containing protein [Acidimicrobiales bacterium]
MAAQTHYEVLGVPRTADRETIRKAYIVAARASHPDRQSPQVAHRQEAELRIRAVNAAWNVLGDSARRHDYDESLMEPAAWAPPRGTTPDLEDHRPPPPSGIVVSEGAAFLWIWLPAVLGVVIAAALIIGSAYATSNSASSRGSQAPSVSTATRFTKGSCVVVQAGPSGKIAQEVSCNLMSSGVIDSVVETPRPCRPSTVEYQLYDGKTTLCLLGAPATSP